MNKIFTLNISLLLLLLCGTRTVQGAYRAQSAYGAPTFRAPSSYRPYPAPSSFSRQNYATPTPLHRAPSLYQPTSFAQPSPRAATYPPSMMPRSRSISRPSSVAATYPPSRERGVPYYQISQPMIYRSPFDVDPTGYTPAPPMMQRPRTLFQSTLADNYAEAPPYAALLQDSSQSFRSRSASRQQAYDEGIAAGASYERQKTPKADKPTKYLAWGTLGLLAAASIPAGIAIEKRFFPDDEEDSPPQISITLEPSLADEETSAPSYSSTSEPVFYSAPTPDTPSYPSFDALKTWDPGTFTPQP